MSDPAETVVESHTVNRIYLTQISLIYTQTNGIAEAREADLRLDVAHAYRDLSTKLENIVRLEVPAPDAVIEDACQVAWSKLLGHSRHVPPENALAWLVRTATCEARRLVRRECRDLSLETELEQPPTRLDVAPPHERAEQREHLKLLHGLPERQQRMLWLQALGLSYVEIARYIGCTPRTVERQLVRAKNTVRQAAA
jgi:RNA polymerase sigma factor (sigma-70 family)